MSAKNSLLIHEYCRVIWENQHMHRLPEFVAPGVVMRALSDEPNRRIVGIDAFGRAISEWLGLYESVTMTVLHSVSEADTVAWQWQLCGEVSEPKLLRLKEMARAEDVAPTNRICAVGMSFSTFLDQRIVEQVTQSDVAGFFGQLGYPPKPFR